MSRCLPSALALLLLLGACGGADVEVPEAYVSEQKHKIRQQSGTIHGNPKGLVIYSDKGGGLLRGGGGAGDPAAPAVNNYLWQAALESLDFMPLAQADSAGGVIITDWYAPPETPEERFKLTVYIRGTDMRADSVKVTVFRQVRQNNEWVDATVDPKTAPGLENNILTRARELRVASVGEEES